MNPLHKPFAALLAGYLGLAACVSSAHSDSEFGRLFEEGCLQNAANYNDSVDYFRSNGFRTDGAQLVADHTKFSVVVDELVDANTGAMVEGANCSLVGWTANATELWALTIESAKLQWPESSFRGAEQSGYYAFFFCEGHATLIGEVIRKGNIGDLFSLTISAANFDIKWPTGACE